MARTERVAFPSGESSLEGVIRLPAGEGPFPGVVMCHPHPLYGGNMDSSVVTAVTSTLEQAGIASLRFNFRGVGRSTGEYDQGVGEREDVLAGVNYFAALDIIDKTRIGIAGYSFGALMALGAAVINDSVSAVAAISPPLSMANLDNLLGYSKPKLFIIGENDDFTSPQRLAFLVGPLLEPKNVEIVPKADHFWFGLEDLVAPKVSSFFTIHLSRAYQK